MSEILHKTITITKVEEEVKKVKIQDENNVKYSIWKMTSKGTMSSAYDFWLKMNDKFQTLEISYTEQPDSFVNKEGKKIDFVYRNIIGFKGDAQIFKREASITQPQVMEQKIATDKVLREQVKEVNWDAIAFGKCKHAFLVELIKTGKTLHEVESIAEDWANASMRKIEKTPVVVKADKPISDANAFIDEMYINDKPKEDIINLDEIPF